MDTKFPICEKSIYELSSKELCSPLALVVISDSIFQDFSQQAKPQGDCPDGDCDCVDCD